MTDQPTGCTCQPLIATAHYCHEQTSGRGATIYLPDPDAHMKETLRLRTAALRRLQRSNDLLRRENDDLRARLARVGEVLDDPWHPQSIDTRHDVVRVTDLRAAIDGTP